jgi:hypothetical protein
MSSGDEAQLCDYCIDKKALFSGSEGDSEFAVISNAENGIIVFTYARNS